MGNNRSKVPDLEKLVKGGRKKFVRYEEGAMLYSMGVHTFQQLQQAIKFLELGTGLEEAPKSIS